SSDTSHLWRAAWASCPTGVVGDRGPPDGHPVAVLESLAGDALAVDERPVRAAEVTHDRLEPGAVGRHADLRVAPRDAGVVEDDVALLVAADDVDRAHEEEAVIAAGEVGPVARAGAAGHHLARLLTDCGTA